MPKCCHHKMLTVVGCSGSGKIFLNLSRRYGRDQYKTPMVWCLSQRVPPHARAQTPSFHCFHVCQSTCGVGTSMTIGAAPATCGRGAARGQCQCRPFWRLPLRLPRQGRGGCACATHTHTMCALALYACVHTACVCICANDFVSCLSGSPFPLMCACCMCVHVRVCTRVCVGLCMFMWACACSCACWCACVWLWLWLCLCLCLCLCLWSVSCSYVPGQCVMI